jgi:hypothetical protein
MPGQLFTFYQIKRIFLACPGDLVSERSRFPRLIETVNNLRAHSLGFHLEAVGWERVISSFGRPQDLINRELELSDLAVILFWNRIGSPSSNRSPKTGTVEEFELARTLHSQSGRPLVWIYFRRPTSTEGDQLDGVAALRRSIEEQKDIFFREYDALEDWEEMFRQHLVAYLDGLKRWDVDRNYKWMRPEYALLRGEFIAEGIYSFGTVLRLSVDLDGDGDTEEIGFMYSHGGYTLWVKKFDRTLPLALPSWVQPDEDGKTPKTIHVAVRDVTNDGLPEILLAAHDGMMDLKVAVFGFNSDDARANRRLDPATFSQLQVLEHGQHTAYVFEGGTIRMPYGSAGLAWTCRWEQNQFVCGD